jgi:hypothetical protein
MQSLKSDKAIACRVFWWVNEFRQLGSKSYAHQHADTAGSLDPLSRQPEQHLNTSTPRRNCFESELAPLEKSQQAYTTLSQAPLGLAGTGPDRPVTGLRTGVSLAAGSAVCFRARVQSPFEKPSSLSFMAGICHAFIRSRVGFYCFTEFPQCA